jgi:hypothetical protein
MASKWDRMMKQVSDRQIALARKFQYAQITSYSQAIKEFANHDDKQIEAWKRELTAKTEAPVTEKPVSSNVPSRIVAYPRTRMEMLKLWASR